MGTILLGYLTGSLPFAYLLARRAGVDVRRAGSGNVGAANVLRTTGTWRGVAAMGLDVAKGAAAVEIARRTAGAPLVVALAGAAAVVGHVYPVWLRFHGGKGVAVAAIEPSETYRVSQTVQAKSTAATAVAWGVSRPKTPAATATPFPPWNRSHTG